MPMMCTLATSCHYKAKNVQLKLLNKENDDTFHRNQDFGDVNNKQVLDDQILVLYAYTPLKRKKNNRPNLPFTSMLYSLAQ